MREHTNGGWLRVRGSLVGAFAVAVAVLAACGGGGGGAEPPPIVPPPAATAAIQGRVVDIQDGTPVEGASVKAGAATATSGADGSYVLANVAPGTRVTVVAEAADYAESVRITTARENATTTFDVKLLKVGVAAQVSAADGGVVSVPGSAAQVTLPPNFAAKADGSAPTGSVTVKVTPVSPAADSSVMPGDYTAVSGSGTVSIESFGALTVNLVDASGAPLNLAAGKTATIRIPLSTRSSGVPAATIPLWYINPQTGLWVPEGTATLAGTAPNQYYEGTVTHFSTWNADQVLDSVVVTGCVKDAAGAAAAGVEVRSDGISYSGTSSAVTDASGNFNISIKKSGQATLGGFKGDQFSNEVRVGPYAVDFVMDPASCLQLASAANSIKVKLTWGSQPFDVDSYMTLPTGEVIDYSARGSLLAEPFVNLDVDDTSSFGPEIVTIRKPMVGTYQYAVRNFSGTHAPGITGSPTKVELTLGGTTTIYAPPAGEPAAGDTVWAVFNLTVASNCAVSVTVVGTWSVTEPTTILPVTTPVYCVAP